MLFSIWAKTFLAFIVSRYEPSSLRMRIGNANVASTELGTVLKRKSRLKTHLDNFGIRHFHNLSPKDKLDICKIKGFICGTTSCNGRYAMASMCFAFPELFRRRVEAGLAFDSHFGAIGVFLDFSRQHRKMAYTAQNQNCNEIHLFKFCLMKSKILLSHLVPAGVSCWQTSPEMNAICHSVVM